MRHNYCPISAHISDFSSLPVAKPKFTWSGTPLGSQASQICHQDGPSRGMGAIRPAIADLSGVPKLVYAGKG